MRFNTIASTIMRMYKLAAPNKILDLDINDVLHWSAEDIEEVLRQGHIIADKKQKGEYLTAQDKDYLKLFEALLDYQNRGTYHDKGSSDNFIHDRNRAPGMNSGENGMNDYNYVDTPGTSIRQNERIISVSGGPLDDSIKELVENPLFPGIWATRSSKNYLSAEVLMDEMKKVDTYLKRNKQKFDKLNDHVRSVRNIIQQYNKLGSNIERAKQKITSSNERQAELKSDQEQAKKRLEDILGSLYQEQQDSNGTVFIDLNDQAQAAQNASLYWPDIEVVYKLGSQLESLKDELSQTRQARDDEIDRANDVREGKKSGLSTNETLETILDKVKRLTTKVEELQKLVNQAALIRQGKVNQARVIDTGKLDPNISWPNDMPFEHMDDGSSNITDWAAYVHWFNSLTNELSALNGGIERPTFNDDGTVNSYTTINQAIKAHKDNTTMGMLNTQIKQTIIDIKQSNQIINTSTVRQQNMEDVYNQALEESQSQDFADAETFVSEYTEQQAYRLQLSTVSKTMKRGRGKNNILKESEISKQLATKIDELAQRLSDILPDYEAAMKVQPSYRNQEQIAAERLYNETSTALSKARKDFANNERTISQKFHDINIDNVRTPSGANDIRNISKINIDEITKKIISRVTANKSLLGILLTQSVDKFVAEYLDTNQYMTADMADEIKSLHYYSSSKPDEENKPNTRIKTNFKDAAEVENILNQMIDPLIREKKISLFKMFLQILKRDYEHIYQAYALPDTYKFVFVESMDPNVPYRDGPTSISQIKKKYKFKDKDVCKIGTVFTGNNIPVKAPDGTVTPMSLELTITYDDANGIELENYVNNPDNPNNIYILKLFKRVKAQFKEYIRKRLHIAAYEICRNVGNEFYGVSLASVLVPNISQMITQDTLEQYLGTKDKYSKKTAEQVINANIFNLKDKIIRFLCHKFNTNSEYIMLVEFLRKHNVNDPEMQRKDDETNSDYIHRLQSVFGRTMEIFNTELERHIKRRINLCTYELEARDKKKYNDVIDRNFNANADGTLDFYTKRITGYTDDQGKKVPGLEQQCSQISKEIRKIEEDIKQHLESEYRSELSSQEFDIMYSNIIKMLQFNDDFKEAVNTNRNKLRSLEAEKDPKQLEQSAKLRKQLGIIIKAFTDILNNGFDQRYRETYSKFNRLNASLKEAQEYVSAAGDAMSRREDDVAVTDLRKCYTELYGKDNNPLVAMDSYFSKRLSLAKHPPKNAEEQKAAEAELNSLYSKAMIDVKQIVSRITKIINDIRQDPTIEENEKTKRVSDTINGFGLNGKIFELENRITQALHSKSKLKTKAEIDKVDEHIKSLERMRESYKERAKQLLARIKDLSEILGTKANLVQNIDGDNDSINDDFDPANEENMLASQASLMEMLMNRYLQLSDQTIAKETAEAEAKQQSEADSAMTTKNKLLNQVYEKVKSRTNRTHHTDDEANRSYSSEDERISDQMNTLDSAEDITSTHMDKNGNELSYDQWMRAAFTNPTALQDKPNAKQKKSWQADNPGFNIEKEISEWMNSYMQTPIVIYDPKKDEPIDRTITLPKDYNIWAQSVLRSNESFYRPDIPSKTRVTEWLKSHPQYEVQNHDAEETNELEFF